MSSVLTTGTGALVAFQRALATTSNNVANIKTQGYSRQRVDFASQPSSRFNFGYVGNGVKVSDVGRVADQLAISRLLDSGGELARLNQLSSLSNRVDELFSNPATNVNGLWSDFFDSMSGLTSNASATADREAVLASGNALTTRLKQLNVQLDSLASEVNNNLTGSVEEVNRLAKQIASLNKDINNDVNRAPPNLLDQRDELVRQLVSFTGGTAVIQDASMINVYSAGGQPLVVGGNASELVTISDPFRPERLNIGLQNGQGVNLVLQPNALGGSIGGMMEFRTTVLDPAYAELGRIATGLAEAFNTAHHQGMDLNGNLGADFFSIPDPKVGAHNKNTGSATIQATRTDVAALTNQNVELRFNGGGWSAIDNKTGVTVPITGAGTAASPLKFNGMELVVTGTPANGDSFLVQPTAGVAGTMTVAITDPNRIAAASPIQGSANLKNTGTGRLSNVVVTNPKDTNFPTASTPIKIDFLSPTTYSISINGINGTPLPYTPGQTISANGVQVTLDGLPATGDSFSLTLNGAGNSDNTNALVLAKLDNKPLLNGGNTSLNASIGALTTTVGASARQAEYSLKAQEVIQDQAQSNWDSISGVNLDEEAANLIQLQQAYQAAAQIISTADTLFQTLINAVR